MSGLSFEPQHHIPLEQRVLSFRDKGLIINLPEEFSELDIVDSYLVGGGNNADFAKLFGRIEEILDQIMFETRFLNEVKNERADNLHGIIHELRNRIEIYLEGVIDEISTSAYSLYDLSSAVSNIPSSNLDELAQITHDVSEMLQLITNQDDEDCIAIKKYLNQETLTKMNMLRERLTLIEDLARMIELCIKHAQQ